MSEKRDTQHFGAGPIVIFRKKGQLQTTISLVVLSFHGKPEDGDIAKVGHVVQPLYTDNEKCPKSDAHDNASVFAATFKISK